MNGAISAVLNALLKTTITPRQQVFHGRPNSLCID